jgi:O-antigen/teichoic acid export membrane protein
VAIVAGVSALGVWSLAYRFVLVPQMVFIPVMRVSYPAIARLIERGKPARALVVRGLEISAVLSGGLMVFLAALVPGFIPSAFGTEWSGAIDPLGWAFLGILLMPLVSIDSGYLWARSAPTPVLAASITRTVVTLAIALPFLHLVGIGAIGFGWGAGLVVEALILASVARTELETTGLRQLMPSVGCALLLGGAGWIAATRIAPSVPASVALAAAAAIAYVAALAIVSPSQFRRTVRFARFRRVTSEARAGG